MSVLSSATLPVSRAAPEVERRFGTFAGSDLRDRSATAFGWPKTSVSPALPRISSREVTGNIACAARMLSSPGGSASCAGVLKPVAVVPLTRMSQNMVVHSETPRLNTSVALRGISARPAPSVRVGPRPLPPVPIDTDSPSAVCMSG